MRHCLAVLVTGVFLSATIAWSDDVVVPRDAGVTFTLRVGDKPDKLRVVVTIDGQSPEIAWEAFLTRFFNFFDLDGNGELTSGETERMLPLPMIAGNESPAIRFETLDANRDGKVTRAEWVVYVKGRGLSAVVGIWEKPSEEDLQLGRIFAAALDENRDSRVDTGELKRGGRLLRRYDLNDDEFLDRKEFLPEATVGQGRTALDVIRDEGVTGSVLRVNLGKEPSASFMFRGEMGDAPKFDSAADGRFLLQGAAASWKLAGTTTRNAANMKSAGEFLSAQLRSALGERESIAKTEVEGDLALTNLLDLFAYADRNQDGRLTLKEWTDYLELIDAGLQAQICIRISDHGHNLFPIVDRDDDGRLSGLELAQIGGPWVAELVTQLPRILRMEFGAIPIRSWGGITIAGKKPTARTAVPAEGPRWFLSLDRNGDGLVSRREFLGPPEVFQRLDKNGDGLIQRDETGEKGGEVE